MIIWRQLLLLPNWHQGQSALIEPIPLGSTLSISLAKVVKNHETNKKKR